MTTTLTLTADELLRLPDDGRRFELLRGELITMTPAGGRHGAINGLITLRLGEYVHAHRSGVVLTEDTAFRLSSDPDTVRCPDVSFIGRDRIPSGGVAVGFIDGAPDLAVEVLSPADTVYEVEQKVEEYLAAGTRAVWVVNPKLRRVTVHTADAAPRILHEDDALEGEELLPDFSCRVRELLDWPE